MIPNLRFDCVVLLAFAVVCGSGAATAAPSLPDALKAADAKYLEIPDAEWADDTPKLDTGDYDEEGAPGPREISQGAVRALLTLREERRDDGESALIPIVTIFADGKEVAKIEGEDVGFADPPLGLQIAEMDPGNSYPEVVVSFYTGGAHCCSDTSVFTASADGSSWKQVDIGMFDGSPMFAADIDGDGRYEFGARDNAFLYAFACYACSETPLQVIGVENGEMKNVTGEPRFQPAHAGWLKQMIESVSEDGDPQGEDMNGFLAGYVGEKILLGEGKQAWELMLAHYDKESEWGLAICNQPLDEDGECPGGEVKLTFPEALEHMLKENGYKLEN
jgi:hypothetical protein